MSIHKEGVQGRSIQKHMQRGSTQKYRSINKEGVYGKKYAQVYIKKKYTEV
jgi:hypothetical protein